MTICSEDATAEILSISRSLELLDRAVIVLSAENNHLRTVNATLREENTAKTTRVEVLEIALRGMFETVDICLGAIPNCPAKDLLIERIKELKQQVLP